MAKLRVLAENPPPPRGYVEEQLRELRDYITRLKDELEFLMTHLGEDNLDADMAEHVRSLGRLRAQEEKTEAAVAELDREISDLGTALDGKQDILTFDDAPTEGSGNPVKSGGVYAALDGKQDALTFDDAPAEGSGNPVTSGGIFAALPVSTDTIQGSADNPVTKSYALSAGGRYLVLVQRINSDAGLYAVLCRASGATDLLTLSAPAGTTYFTVSSGTRTLSVTAKEVGVAVNILRFGVAA